MRRDVKATADAFLLKKYGFNEETRQRLIEKASLEIVQNCIQLRSAIYKKELIVVKKYAHKLKSNLTALGLSVLSEKAKEIERIETCEATKTLLIAMDLCCKITENI